MKSLQTQALSNSVSKESDYPYITEDNLVHTQAYNYTSFGGVKFLHAYVRSRAQCIKSVDFEKIQIEDLSQQMNEQVRESLCIGEKGGNVCHAINEHTLRLLIKTFEINKRLYEEYNYTYSILSGEQILKPNKQSSFFNLANYLGFAHGLGRAWKHTSNLLFLNTLLKLNDTLISLIPGGGGGIYALFAPKRSL